MGGSLAILIRLNKTYRKSRANMCIWNGQFWTFPVVLKLKIFQIHGSYVAYKC